MGNSKSTLLWRLSAIRKLTPSESASGEGLASVANQVTELPVYAARMNFYKHFLNALYAGNEQTVQEALNTTANFTTQVDDINKSKNQVLENVRMLNQEGGGFYQDMMGKINGQQDHKKAEAAQRTIFQKFETDPVFSPKTMEVNNTDRVIFIAMTFAFRSISLFLIEWAIHNRMITTFENAFLMYFVLYLSLFFMWVVLVNINQEDVFLPSMFYYVNLGAEKGYVRTGIHCIAQLLLLPLPFVIRDKPSSADALTFEERRAIVSMLQRFTFFIWILTSVIALRV